MAEYRLLSAHTNKGVADPSQINNALNSLGTLPSNSINYSFTSIRSSLNLIPSVFIVILIALSFFLFVSILIVLSYSISVTVDDSKIDFATLLSQGFTKRKILTNYMVKPFVNIFIGGLLGLPGQFVVYKIITNYLSQLTGIYWGGSRDLKISVISSILVIVILLVLCLLRFLKVFKVSPTDAINKINTSQNKNSKFHLSISKSTPKVMNVRLGLNKFFNNFRQSNTLLFVTTLLTFVLVISIGLSRIFSSTDKALRFLGADNGDIILLAKGNKNSMDNRLNNLIRKIGSTNKISYSSLSDNEPVGIDHESTSATILNNFNQKNTLLKGDYPNSDKELLISNGLSKKLSRGLNDKIRVKFRQNTRTYKISGVYSSLDNNCESLRMSSESFKRLDRNFIPGQAIISLPSYNEKQVNRIINKFDNTSNINIQNGKASYISGVTYIRVILKTLIGFIFVITAVFSVMLLIMLVKLSLIRELTQIETLKMIGFTNARIKIISLYRYISVIISGQILGIIIAALLGNILVNMLFNSIGLAGIPMKIPFGTIIVVCILILLFSVITILSTIRERKIAK